MIYCYDGGIWAIDAHHGWPEFAAVYVLPTADGVMLIETAHNASLPLIESGLARIGVSPESVRFIFVTHVHLDHAGGAGSYMKRFHHARLVVHERGKKHMADPTRLSEAATAVYGPEKMAELYGELVPIMPELIITPKDGESIRCGGRSVVCLDTPGHTTHHLSFYLEDAGTVFTGDAFGVGLPIMESGGRQGIAVTTAPAQFDPDAMRDTIQRIETLSPERVMLTHFGEMRDTRAAGDILRRQIDAHVEAADGSDGTLADIERRLTDVFAREREAQGWGPAAGPDSPEIHEITHVNSLGLEAWLGRKKKREAAAG